MNQSVIAYIGLGSNLSNPIAQINSAREFIKTTANLTEIAFSSLYCSPPMGPENQPNYVNAVMAISTALPPIDLLRYLQKIESDHGRIRVQRWGARTLDLDLLLYGDQQINIPDLIVPHIGLSERAFVLYPLHEIASDLEIPFFGSVKDLVAACSLNGLEKL
ncbi:MAG: 2-amino-4-hydroxy-6-hydroxymethyldihydropteridine diphosphokinase [Methylococcales bacterium]|nr:2-amino-4-hydroxy-6-hydroxymethyldihydropteridine diphosphokinase [Methylococcales bacterium]